MSSWLDRDPAYQEFLEWMDDNCQDGLIDPASIGTPPRILDTHVLQAYFKDNNNEKLNKLLRMVFRGEEVPVDTDKVAENCAQVFCTLLLIKKPEHIQRFMEYANLQDSHLPFHNECPPLHFPKCGTDKESAEFLQRFCENQWIVCAPKIDFQSSRTFEDGQILPIKVKKRLGGGGSALLYEIEICPTYNQLCPSNGDRQLSDHRNTNTYVLKTYYGRDAKRYYASEVSAFRRLRKRTDNMIGFFGGFKHGDRYNIILEYADVGTLEDYFKSIAPPTTGEEIIMFWDHMFKLIEALLCVHEGKVVLNPDGTSEPLHGWHQDVKPSNILITTFGKSLKSPYEWLFKLADLGVSHFKTLDPSADEPEDVDSQGTRTYGAPECCRPDETLARSKLNVTPTVDVWSLGAVFSEAAVWLVMGYQSLKEYRRERQTAANNCPNVKGTDCFHDGHRMLNMIPQWHKRLNASLRSNDVITGQVLIMIESMLYDETSRPKTKYFWTWSQNILEKAKEDLKERKLGSDPNTPTKPRPPTSSSVSDSTSSAPSHADTTAENIGPFGDLPRVLSPHALHDHDNFDQGHIGGQLGRSGSQQNNLTQGGPHFFQPRQLLQRVTFQNSTNPTFSPNMGPRAQSHDIGSGQQMHQTTQSMSKLDLHRETEFDQSSPGRVNSARNAVSMPPGTSGQFGESLYRTQRGETSESFGNVRHVQESFPRNVYPQTDFSQGPPAPGNQYHGQFEEGPSGIAGPSGTQVWPQENFSLQQPHPNLAPKLPINGESFHGDDHPMIPMGYWNPNTAPAGRLGPASPAPQQAPMQQYMGGFHQNEPASMMAGSRQVTTSTSPTQPSRYLPPEATPPMLEPPQVVPLRPRWHPPAVLYTGTAISELRNGRVEALEGYELLFPRLKKRDHVFIVDDALSMSTHWGDVEAVFVVLAKIVKAADPDGIDLHFTMSDEVHNSKTVWGSNSSSKLVKQVRERRHKLRGTINITYRLDAILGPHIAKLSNAYSRRGGTIRPLNIYVLTDGVWEPGCDPSSTIKNIVDKLTEFGYSNDSKQVGIQFISFGNDKNGLKRLKDLDDNLEQAMDIVDTTPSNGNVWKMLLGAIDRTFDESFDES